MPGHLLIIAASSRKIHNWKTIILAFSCFDVNRQGGKKYFDQQYLQNHFCVHLGFLIIFCFLDWISLMEQIFPLELEQRKKDITMIALNSEWLMDSF